MAQVKKFNTGGSVQKMKYGNIIKNGTTYEMTEESMKRLEQYIAAADPDIQQSLANDWKLLMSGQDVTIDTMANRRSTVPEDFSKGQLRRLGKDKATESKWHGAVNSDIHKYNLATQYLGKFDPSKSYKIEETPQKDFWKSNKSIEYDIEDDGTKKYRGLSNTDEKNYYDNVTAYLMGDDAFRAQYKDPGISNFETLDSWFKSLPNPEEFVKNLWNKIENGQELNSDESQFWTAIGMKFGDPKANPKYEEKVKSDETQAAKEKAWDAFNVGNVWNDSEMNSDYLVYNPTTGTFTVKMPTLDGSIGYHFNDDFVANNYGYDHLKGKVEFNGVWYNEKDLYNPESELYRMLTHKQYDYRNKNLRGDFDAANQVLKTNWSGVKYIPTSNEYIGTFNNGNYRYEDIDYLTPTTTYGSYDIADKDWNLIKAMNMDGEANILGVRPSMYILTDAYGRYIDPSGKILDTPYKIDPTLLKNIYSGQTRPENQTIDFYHRLSTDENDPYYNTYADKIDYQLENAPTEGWADIDTDNRYLYVHPNFGGKENTVFSSISKTIYDALHSDVFWTKYANADRNTQFLFSELIRGKKLSAEKLNKIDWTSLGIGDQLKTEIINYFLNNRKTINRPESFKEGGIIKYQTPSGPIGERKIDDKVVALSEQMNSPYEQAKFNPWVGVYESFTPTDRLDAWSLGLDVAGGAAGWIPTVGDGLNVLLSTLGATITGAIADNKRVKQGVLPEGTAAKNAAMNVGADVLSLIPVAGDVFNFGKMAKRASRIVSNIGSVINLSMAFAGAPRIATSVDKFIHNPEEVTLEDWRNLYQGWQILRAGTTRAARAVKDSRLAAKSGAEHPYKIKYKNNSGSDVEVNLDKDDVKALTSAVKKENVDQVMNQILAKHNIPENLRADIKAKGPSAFGFIHKYGRWMLPDVVKETPSQKDAMYYLRHPGVRAEVLTERKPIDFARAVDNGASRTRAATHMKLNNQEAPEGYELTRKGKNLWHKSLEKKTTKKSSSQQNNVSNQSSSAQSASQQTPPKSTGYQNDPVYFKEGGILKAQNGLDYLETPYTKKLKQLYDIKLNPNGMITGSAPTGVGIDKPTDPTKPEKSLLPIETEIIEFPSMFKELDNDYHVDLMGTKRQATQHAKKFAKDHSGFDHFWWEGKKYGLNGKPYGWGQNPSEPLKPWVVPTAVDALMSSARLGFDRKTNEIITAQKAKGIREAADASMLSKQEFIPQRMQLTAGDASKAAANRMFQHLPPVNSDYIKYAAQQRAGFDAANTMLAQSDREYSAQYSENLDKNIARQQMIADRNMQIEAQNRQIQAQKMAALSELYASRDAANRQSIANYGIEQQTKYEQGMQKAREARLAREKSKWTIDAQKMYVNDLTKDIDVKSAYDAYLATNPTTPLSIENWVAGEPQFRNKVNEYMQKATQWIADQQLETELQYLPPIYKSGGKMRSASDQIAINREKANDQIKVNKYKSFDKNWEDQNKAVRKAIGKMHDRVYNILMKILS